jgi:hypothetical protein
MDDTEVLITPSTPRDISSSPRLSRVPATPSGLSASPRGISPRRGSSPSSEQDEPVNVHHIAIIVVDDNGKAHGYVINTETLVEVTTSEVIISQNLISYKTYRELEKRADKKLDFMIIFYSKIQDLYAIHKLYTSKGVITIAETSKHFYMNKNIHSPRSSVINKLYSEIAISFYHSLERKQQRDTNPKDNSDWVLSNSKQYIARGIQLQITQYALDLYNELIKPNPSAKEIIHLNDKVSKLFDHAKRSSSLLSEF